MSTKKQTPIPTYEDPRIRNRTTEAIHSINRLEFAAGTILGFLSIILLLIRGKLADEEIVALQNIIHSPYFSLDWMFVLATLLTFAGIAFIIKSLVPLFKLLK